MFEQNEINLIVYNMTEFANIFLERVTEGCDNREAVKLMRHKILLNLCSQFVEEYLVTFGNDYLDDESEKIIKQIIASAETILHGDT